MRSAVVCIAKDEENYLDEWVRYHTKLGFSEIFVYQNNWRYPMGPYEDPRIHLLEFDEAKISDGCQNRCYNSFIQEYSSDFDFAAFIDVDEFLSIDPSRNLDEVLSSYSKEDCVYVNWRIFGDGGHKWVENGDYSCIRRFTMCDDRLHRLGKNILNLRKNGRRYSFFNPHISLLDGKIFKYSDANLETRIERIWDRFPEKDQVVELYHFKNKTFPELFNRKYRKGDAFYSKGNPVYQEISSLRKDFEELNSNKIVNTRLLEFMYGDKENGK